MKIKRPGALISALILAFASLLSISFPQLASAAAPYTCAWTGTAGDGKFSTATNWSSCNGAAPVATDNDNLVFDNTSPNLTSNQVLNNDISGLHIGTMTFQGSNASDYVYEITGNAISLTAGITANGTDAPVIGVTLNTAGSLTFNSGAQGGFGASPITIGYWNGSAFTGSLSGSGNITLSGTSGILMDNDNSAFTGSITTSTGLIQAGGSNELGGSGATINIQNGGALQLCVGGSASYTYPNNITLAGTGNGSLAALYVGSCGGPVSSPTVTLSGNITLGSDVQIGGGGGTSVTVDLTGTLGGPYTLSVASGTTLVLNNQTTSNTSKTPGGSSQSTLQVTTINPGDNQPTQSVTVGSNQEYIIDGVRGVTSVVSGGILKGNGQVGNLQVYKGGTVAPGHSPGCLTVSGNLNEGGTYQAEIGGTTACTQYDQLIVTGNVTLDDGNTPPTQGVLQLSVVNGFKPQVGQTFEIINNKGTNLVSDTFSGLAEGATINVGGNVFKITYKGGDGNDVVLTVITAASPNTGFGLTSFNTATPMIGALCVAGGIFLISRKTNLSFAKRR